MEEDDSQNIASQDIVQEIPAQNVFIAPSIHEQAILDGASYTHHSKIPEVITQDISTECVLGVDEAGRGPVLGNSSYSSNVNIHTNHHQKALWSMVCSTFLWHNTGRSLLRPIILMILKFLLQLFAPHLCRLSALQALIFINIAGGRLGSCQLVT